MPDAVLVFIAPPSPADAARAPRGPGHRQPEQIERRLAVAERELGARDEFGHVIVNDDVDRAAAELAAGAIQLAQPIAHGRR